MNRFRRCRLVGRAVRVFMILALAGLATMATAAVSSLAGPQATPTSTPAHRVYLPASFQNYAPDTPDLGGVPDSSNSYGVGMTASPAGGLPGVLARFPTLFGAGSPPNGPLHFNKKLAYYLGPAITAEKEADIGFDADGITTPTFLPCNPTPSRCLWWRITLSSQPAIAADGSGPSSGYEWFDALAPFAALGTLRRTPGTVCCVKTGVCSPRHSHILTEPWYDRARSTNRVICGASTTRRRAQPGGLMDQPFLVQPDVQRELVEFAQQLVRIKSLSGQEGDIQQFIKEKMLALGYDEVIIDGMGNLLGRVGGGARSILFDSHVDTVAVTDEARWAVPPFSGAIVDGRLYGRGSVDMKASVAATVYAGALARAAGLTAGKTVYVSCSVFEEDCDGENLKHLFGELALRPTYVVICEPSGNQIALGHKGKVQSTIKTHGVSAHGSAPEKGVNAIYEMAEIIQRVERTNLALVQRGEPRPTLVMSRIASVAASLNAVPSECEVYLDRRTVPGETEDDIRQELAGLIAGKNATWEVGTLRRTSWTGLDIVYEPFHPAWRIGLDHALTQACITAYRTQFGAEPSAYDFWDFSTNAVTPVSLGIPTIGFGPGDHKLAHMVNEHCPVRQIVDACGFYTSLIAQI